MERYKKTDEKKTNMIGKIATRIKVRLLGILGGISGTTSILGSWQVCHGLCLGLITLLSLIGITIIGMPLIFLQKVALPFWLIAASLLVITLFIYLKKKCISHRLIIFNSGLIIAGIPFKSLQEFTTFFWIIGGILLIISTSLFIKDKTKIKQLKK